MTDQSSRYHRGMVPLGPRAHKLLTRPQAPPRFEITDRDVRLLEGLARFRHLTTEQLATYVGGSLRGVRTRLYLLWANKYIDRPKSQIKFLESYYHHGAPPIVHSLARKGANELARHGLALEHRLDKSFRTPKPTTLEHTLDTAAVMLGLRGEVSAREGLDLIDHHELLPQFPNPTQKLRSPFELAVTFDANDLDNKGRPVKVSTRIAVVPDRLFSLVPGDARFNY